ncbi:MAG: hypothetical protein CVV28_02645 [Methanobacteriales archaeon HGW-Methanobacteriales-1]|nr:MAG: hypothetical protein CVV28_02645 [Methanobacteriales archaeon HGW-Methanobacteriales-1]
MLASERNFFVEKRWALVAIGLGVAVGFLSALICVRWHLIIFGFNIMYIISPLMAGFVETIIARKKYGKSTGAISALLTFLLINIYGWFVYPRIAKEPVTLSLITVLAILLTIQAAFPILINHILFVVVLGTVRKIIEFLVFVPSKITRKPPEVKVLDDNEPSSDEIFLDELNIPLLSVAPADGGKIKKYMGLVGGEAVAQENGPEDVVSKITKVIEPMQLEDIDLSEARKLAISRMLEEAESLGANTVVEVLIDYVSMGGIQGTAFIVTATGTAVLCDK